MKILFNLRKLFTVILGVILIVGCSEIESAINEKSGSDNSSTSSNRKVISVGYNNAFNNFNELTSQGKKSPGNQIIGYFIKNHLRYYKEISEGVWDFVVNEEAIKVEKISEDPLVVTYSFTDKSNWSDGQPVTGVDLLLQWAGRSLLLNDDTASEGSSSDVVFFDGGDGYSQLISQTPSINPNNYKEMTLTWDRYDDYWAYTFSNAGVPAHIVGEIAFDLTDADEALERVKNALENPKENHEDLAKISYVWSNAWKGMTSLPEDERLLVSDGPYHFSKIQDQELYALERNENYSAGPIPHADEINFKYSTDLNVVYQMLKNKEIFMFGSQFPAEMMKEVNQSGTMTAKAIPQYVDEMIYLNQGKTNSNSPFSVSYWQKKGDTASSASFKAKTVRLAFLRAFPEESIFQRNLGSKNPDTVPPDSMIIYQKDPNYEEYIKKNGSDVLNGYSTEQIINDLEEAGIETPLKINLTYRLESKYIDDVLDIIAAENKIGFEVIDCGKDESEYLQARSSGEYDAYYGNVTRPNTLFNIYKDTFVTGGSDNLSFFSNEEVDELWEQAQLTTNEEERLEYAAQIEKIAFSEGFGRASVPILDSITYSDNLIGTKQSPTLFTHWFNFWEWDLV